MTTNNTTYLYLACLSDPSGAEQPFYKIGITGNLKARSSYGLMALPTGTMPTKLQNIQTAILKQSGRLRQPYEWDILATAEMSSKKAAEEHEELLLKSLKQSHYPPAKWFYGYTECFKIDDETISLIKEYFEEVKV